MPPFQKIITIFIADDHPGWIEGVRTIINKASDMQVVGEAQDGDQIKQKRLSRNEREKQKGCATIGAER